MAGIWFCMCALLSAAFFTSISASDDLERDLLGQIQEVSLDNEHLKGINQVVENIIPAFKGRFKIVKAMIQAVGGLMHYLTIRIEMDHLPSGFKICKLVLFCRPWLRKIEVISNGCESPELKATYLQQL
ncbi:hypothetical protein scyTo_0017843 [Scyliorhinus torazame]|uniref:Cystatin domain-containing protein n=1 Tax=Scyliorhinus torazame TaxID=75743 RepID=A0A401Q193_SCYTO|nr:hypothetical protein [Scyliorhinus torazame]